MDIEALKSFLAFVETGSFTRAAKQINRTQSAFSAQMKKLERELRVNLFEKEGRNLVLSEAGSALRSQAEKLVALHGDTLRQVQRYENKRPFRLGCPEDYNDTVLPKVIQALSESQPTCSIQVYSQPSVTLRTCLDEGKLDAAIVTRAVDREEGHWLTNDKGVWIASPSFNKQHFSHLPLALFQADCKYYAAAIDGLTKRGQNYHIVACSDTASAQRALVREGIAIGAIGGLSKTEDLIALDDMPPLPTVDVVLIASANNHPILTKACLDKMTELVQAQLRLA